MMELANLIENGTCYLFPEGRIDTATSNDFQSSALELTAGVLKTAIDFSKVNYISSAGLRAVLVIAKDFNAKGGKILIYGMNDSIKDIFDMSGFTTIIKIVKTKDDAIYELA
jgi:anti-anti-sigma factor